MPTCLLTARAEENLIDIWRSIADDNPVAADKLLDHIEAVFVLLAEYPALGPARPDLAIELRLFVVRNTSSFIGRSPTASRSPASCMTHAICRTWYRQSKVGSDIHR